MCSKPLLHNILSAQISSEYHLPELQLQHTHSLGKANMQPVRIARERDWWRRGRTQPNPPSPMLPIPTTLNYSRPLNRVVVTFHIMNKRNRSRASYKRLGMHSVIHPGLHAEGRVREDCSISRFHKQGGLLRGQQAAPAQLLSQAPFHRDKILSGAAPTPLGEDMGLLHQQSPARPESKQSPSPPSMLPQTPGFAQCQPKTSEPTDHHGLETGLCQRKQGLQRLSLQRAPYNLQTRGYL